MDWLGISGRRSAEVRRNYEAKKDIFRNWVTDIGNHLVHWNKLDIGKKELKQKERPEEKVPQTKRESMSGQLEKEIEKQEEVKSDQQQEDTKTEQISITYLEEADHKFLEKYENALKIFTAEKNSGNGVTEKEMIPKVEILIKAVKDYGTYFTVACEWNQIEVSLIFYQESEKFTFQTSEYLPGETNQYQEAE